MRQRAWKYFNLIGFDCISVNFQKHLYTLQNDQEIYISKLKELINDNGTRLIVNLNHVRQKMPQRAIGSYPAFLI
jgi:hypothetical protein